MTRATPAATIAGIPRGHIVVHPGLISGKVRAPPSKSYTHRALVAAMLARSGSRLIDPLVSEDTQASLRAVQALGATVKTSPLATGQTIWSVEPSGHPPEGPVVVDARESGTTLRLFTAAASLFSTPVRFEGEPGLARRPMDGLLAALRSLGAKVEGPPRGKGLPFSITGPISGGHVEVDASETSQYVSGLLMALPRAPGDSTLELQGPSVSKPYISATLALMRSRGVHVDELPSGYRLRGGQSYTGGDLRIPGDASSATYLLALAAISGGEVEASGLPGEWPQADLALLEVLQGAGAQVTRSGDTVRVLGPPPGELKPFDMDVSDSPDLAPLLAVLAAAARGTSHLTGGTHLRAKESDRRLAMLRLARAMGATAADHGDGITISGPSTKRSLKMEDIEDHRVFMSAVVAALSLPEPSILGNANCVAKSYPGFLRDVARLGLRTEPAD